MSVRMAAQTLQVSTGDVASITCRLSKGGKWRSTNTLLQVESAGNRPTLVFGMFSFFQSDVLLIASFSPLPLPPISLPPLTLSPPLHHPPHPPSTISVVRSGTSGTNLTDSTFNMTWASVNYDQKCPSEGNFYCDTLSTCQSPYSITLTWERSWISTLVV